VDADVSTEKALCHLAAPEPPKKKGVSFNPEDEVIEPKAKEEPTAEEKAKKAAEDKIEEELGNSRARKLMCEFVKEQWYLLLLTAPFVFLGGLGDIAVPAYVGWVIDAMKCKDGEEVNRLIIQWVILLVSGSLCGFINKMLTFWIAERIGFSVRSRLFKSQINKDVGFFDVRKNGDLISRISNDTT